MKTKERGDEYLEFAYMGIPMAFEILKEAELKFVATLTVWAARDDDGAKIAFEIMSKKRPQGPFRSSSDARDAVNDVVIRDHRIVIGTWKRGEISPTVKCKSCGKKVPRTDMACVRDRTSLAYCCLDQCVKSRDKELF
jgi:hypothetical protein